MATYTFLNKNTNEIEEHVMKISELDSFKESNPHLERFFTLDALPAFGDSMRMNVPGVGKADSTFEKYVINRIKETVPGNTLGRTHKTKIPREF
jgi:hypothetical protein